MKKEGLTRFQAKREAQRLANETEQPCVIYREKSLMAARHFGVVTVDEASNWQLVRSVDCRWPEA